MDLGIAICRVLAGGAGAMLVFGALFLYESEAGLIQSRLEALWVRGHDAASRLIPKHVQVVRTVAGAANRALDRIYGPRLMAWGFAGAAGRVTLTTLSVLLLLIGIGDFALSESSELVRSDLRERIHALDLRVLLPLLVVGTFSTIGSANLLSAAFWPASAVNGRIATRALNSFAWAAVIVGASEQPLFIVAVAFTLLGHALSLWVTRASLRRAATSMTGSGQAAALGADCLASLVLTLVVPLWVLSMPHVAGPSELGGVLAQVVGMNLSAAAPTAFWTGLLARIMHHGTPGT